MQDKNVVRVGGKVFADDTCPVMIECDVRDPGRQIQVTFIIRVVVTSETVVEVDGSPRLVAALFGGIEAACQGARRQARCFFMASLFEQVLHGAQRLAVSAVFD